MGSILWKGQTLCSGFSTSIGGKEVELDVEVPASALPDIIGSEVFDKGPDVPEEPPALVVLPPKPEPVQRFNAPTNFYAKSAPLPKAKGPLYVCDAFSSHLKLTRHPDMTHMRQTRS